MLEQYMEILRPQVLNLFKDDSSGHDITHLERTMNNALFLQKYEGGDRAVIEVSAFLHDVHRIMENENREFVSPKESLPRIKEMLSTINLSSVQIDKILHCIEFHEEYNWNNPSNKENDINTLILQDADNLDAIGAIGIGRTFSYGGAHGVPMYNEQISLNIKEDYTEEKGNDASTIHHFYHKLLKLGNNMNTNTAKKLAIQKTKFMEIFIGEFLKEWDGDYKI